MNRPPGRPNARAIFDSVGATAKTFLWTIRLLIPVAAIIAFSVIHAGGYRIAGSVPFTVAGFVVGYGGTLHLLLGLPDAVPNWWELNPGDGGFIPAECRHAFFNSSDGMAKLLFGVAPRYR